MGPLFWLSSLASVSLCCLLASQPFLTLTEFSGAMPVCGISWVLDDMSTVKVDDVDVGRGESLTDKGCIADILFEGM